MPDASSRTAATICSGDCAAKRRGPSFGQNWSNTTDAFLCFSKLMLVDVATAWQRADAELRFKNFVLETVWRTTKSRSF
jgi:hypothetical protein